MDLDELKESWKKIGDGRKRISSETMRTYMNHGSTSPFVRLRKSMMLEMVLVLLSYALLFVIYFSKSFNTNPIALYAIGGFTILGLVSCAIFYSKVYAHTQKMNFSESLEKQLKYNIRMLKSDVNLYLILNLLLFLPAVLVAIILANDKVNAFEQLSNYSNAYWLFVVGLLLVLFPLFYYAIRLWIRSFYGKYIVELEENYHELIAQEEDSKD